MKYNKLQEKILLLRIRTHADAASFTKVYDLFIERIYRFIFFKVRTKEDAQDLTSEVFLKAWRYIHDGKPIESLNAFLYQIARNSVIDYYRKKNNDSVTVDDEVLVQVPGNELDILVRQVDAHVDMKRINKALSSMKEEYRDVIILRYIEQLSIKEVSKVLGKTPSNVKVLAHRALKKLQDLVS